MLHTQTHIIIGVGRNASEEVLRHYFRGGNSGVSQIYGYNILRLSSRHFRRCVGFCMHSHGRESGHLSFTI